MNPYQYQPTTSDMGPRAPGIWGRLLNTASLYGEVLLRSRFGERHLTMMGVLLGMAGLMFMPIVAVAVFTFFLSSFLLGSLGGLFAAALTTQLPWARGTIYFHIFTLTFLGRSCWHFIEMEYRRRAGEQVLSTYSGRPSVLWRLIPGLGQDETTIKRFGEPAAMVLLGLWIQRTDFLLTLYLIISGIALFVKGHFEAFMVSQRLYDLQDQMLESQALGGHIRGRSNQPGEVRGVALPAALEGYVPGQARALASSLLSQFPSPPMPSNDLPGHDMREFISGLPPGFAGLLSQPAPLEELVENWFVEEANLPVADDWFETVPVTKQPGRSAPSHNSSNRGKPNHSCSICGAKFRFNASQSGRVAKCGRCGERFRVPQIAESGSKVSS